MKKFKIVLLAICIAIIVVGMTLAVKNGLIYGENYSQNLLLETVKQYSLYIGISTAIILAYFAIRYYKKNIAKVIAISILGILGACILVFSIIVIVKLPITRLLFPIMLATYVSSIIVLSAYFEEEA